MEPIARPSIAIPFAHAGLAATFYILLREWGFWPWLWPLDEGVWLVAAVAILAGWRWLAGPQNPVARGAVVSALACGLVAIVLTVLFWIFTRVMLHKGVGVGGAPLSGLVVGVALFVLLFIAFFLILGTMVAGLIAGAVSGWRAPAARVLALILAVAGAVVPIGATWCHAALGIGLEDIGPCRERLSDPPIVPDRAALRPKTIAIGSRADCFGQPAKGGHRRNGSARRQPEQTAR